MSFQAIAQKLFKYLDPDGKVDLTRATTPPTGSTATYITGALPLSKGGTGTTAPTKPTAQTTTTQVLSSSGWVDNPAASVNWWNLNMYYSNTTWSIPSYVNTIYISMYDGTRVLSAWVDLTKIVSTSPASLAINVNSSGTGTNSITGTNVNVNIVSDGSSVTGNQYYFLNSTGIINNAYWVNIVFSRSPFVYIEY